jgi:hypothetical protein
MINKIIQPEYKRKFAGYDFKHHRGGFYLPFDIQLFAGAVHYISAAGDNTTGSDWTHAYTNIPTTIVRGDTYYIASGSYGTKNFGSLSGTDYVYLQKATSDDHGTETGWNSSYGVGQAVFSGGGTVFNINMAYLEIDGVTGSGTSGHGIRVNSSSTTDGAAAIYTSSTAATHIVLKHLECNNAAWGSSNASRVIHSQAAYPTGSSDWTIQYCYVHGGRVWVGFTGVVSNLLIEYCHFQNAGSGDGALHSAGLTLCNTNNVTVRYNVFENMHVVGSTTYIEPQFTSQNFYVYGNVFKRTSLDSEGTTQGLLAITSTDTVTNLHFYNNTAYNLHNASATTGFWGGNVGGSSCYVRNNVWKSCENVYIYDPGSNVTDSNNILDGAGVTFVDAANGDFRLTGATPAGYTLSSPYNIDPLGVTRGADGLWDRGAYEYDSGSDPEESAIKFARIG